MSEPKHDFEALQGIIAETFQVDEGGVTRETQFGDFPAWDSMGHMDLMVALESRFGIPITAETISELTSVEAILAQMEAAPRD